MSTSVGYGSNATYTDSIGAVEEVFEYLSIPTQGLLDSASRLHRAAVALDNSPHHDLLRMDVCHRLRLGQDAIFALGDDPIPPYGELLKGLAIYLESAGLLPSFVDQRRTGGLTESQLDETANHYGRLWGGFSPERYFDEASELLRARFVRNGVDLSWFEGKRALDCGCGGGRYSAALKRLGFAEVVGCDWSDEGIEVARRRAREAGIRDVQYVKADVLDLPFENDEFDFVFSNGVLHHTLDTLAGVKELVRTMRPEGRGWLYLYARPGGLDRLTHYLARLLLKSVDKEVCRRYCRALGLQGNRVFFLLDLWLTPIAECYTPSQVEEMLSAAGVSAWSRCKRGADDDLVEQIYWNVAHAGARYGVGENRYLFEGKN